MILLEDTRQQEGKHEIKHQYWEKHGITVRRTKLFCGDYTLPTNQSICIDTKKDIYELIGDICDKRQHVRFRDELERAKESGILLVILVENEFEWLTEKDGIYNREVHCIKDLFRWKNKRSYIFKNGRQMYPKATKGKQLAKSLMTMEKKYGCKFVFCTPRQSPRYILEILTGEMNVKDNQENQN